MKNSKLNKVKPNKEYWYSTCSHNIEFIYSYKPKNKKYNG